MSLLPYALGEVSEAPLAGTIALDVPSIPKSKTCGEVFAWFANNAEVPALVVTDETAKILGLVSRVMFLARYARQYSPELYSKKSILVMANTQPLSVDERTSLTELAEVLAGHPSALLESFAITSNGQYKGLGTVDAVMRAKLQLLQRQQKELALALGHAKEADEAKSNFLALMSHELRTPLNAIIGFSEVICRETFGPIGVSRYAEYLSDIHGAGKHLLALINDILDLSKAESGKIDLHCEPINLPHLVGECQRLMRQRATDARIKLTESVGETGPLFADRLRVKQILLNLLSNAIKFTPAGGKVSITAEIDFAGQVIIAVSDTGIGMPPELIPIALEPFRQIESPLSRNVEGPGLGLALVKTLVEAHGGQLSIESGLDKGTKVLLVFPASRSVASDPPSFEAVA